MRSQCYIILFGLTLGVLGCATTTRHLKVPLNSAAQVLKHVDERREKIKSVSSEGTITLETPDESNTGSFALALQMPDSLKIDICGPFGIRVGSLSLTHEDFVFYNPAENSARIIQIDGSVTNPLLPLEIKFDDILNALIGAPLSLTDSDSISTFFVDDENYVLLYQLREGYKEYRIDRNTFILNTFKLVDSKNGIILTANTSQYEDDEEIDMPMFVRVVVPHKQWSLTIAIDDLEVNTPVNCSITLPKSTKLFHSR
ncbi:MAG: DUF4292 domain-containing protein [Ignavibacteriales bacterium]|nr:DUF4292 domain-containing protein [Ignavibacteriales bacterium]